MTLIISINTIDCNTLVKMDDRKRKNASRNLNLNFTWFDCEGPLRLSLLELGE